MAEKLCGRQKPGCGFIHSGHIFVLLATDRLAVIAMLVIGFVMRKRSYLANAI